MSLLGFACIKSGSALVSPDRQMSSREKKAVYPVILLRLFDPEGLGAATGLGVTFQWVRNLGLTCPASPAGGRAPSAPILLRKG
ncbi:DNA helicase [Rossellomorea vietnamensis]|uniref:DNA helicase n=1 Tax=Rossellomorea vietnamensis TaxID=218284 RepID=A0A5D4MJ48_9BACI|nr:DNA helicase [Rossellomorea vietnamensis]